jgi:hypothetical protein
MRLVIEIAAREEHLSDVAESEQHVAVASSQA